jgi:hypothetical protein
MHRGFTRASLSNTKVVRTPIKRKKKVKPGYLDNAGMEYFTDEGFPPCMDISSARKAISHFYDVIFFEKFDFFRTCPLPCQQTVYKLGYEGTNPKEVCLNS